MGAAFDLSLAPMPVKGKDDKNSRGTVLDGPSLVGGGHVVLA
jgi:hypothetical protein